ncbi:MAG TPA: transposase [Candidatus Paceibacterota bacterium]|jgi:putative transposase|nr:transposase [Candidatus Paceibacterota bacterium]
MRKQKFGVGEKFHVFNRGVDKRHIFLDKNDVERFLLCMKIFNDVELSGSLKKALSKKYMKSDAVPLVNFIAHSPEINHFHFILEEAVENGISKFIKRVTGGYAWYFNNKYKRSGTLFESPFKAKHIGSNEYLLYVSAYVNLNDQQKQYSDLVAGISSWGEYKTNKPTFCTHKHLVLDQFESPEDYERYALEVLEQVKLNKQRYKLLDL